MLVYIRNLKANSPQYNFDFSQYEEHTLVQNEPFGVEEAITLAKQCEADFEDVQYEASVIRAYKRRELG